MGYAGMGYGWFAWVLRCSCALLAVVLSAVDAVAPASTKFGTYRIRISWASSVSLSCS